MIGTIDRPPEAPPPSIAERQRPPRRRHAILRGLILVWKYAVGMLLCQSLVGGVLVVGWTYRLVQRSVIRTLWARSGRHLHGETFADYLEGRGSLEPREFWPNWILGHRFRELFPRPEGMSRRAQCGALWRSLAHSLWLNLRIGVQGVFNTSLFVLPSGALMLFSWYDGWNNSFSKGYEQAVVGPAIGFAGIAAFIAAMLYVPMAQARQAATGDWRAFHHYRFIMRLVRRRWMAAVVLAALYAALSFPVLVLHVIPGFLPQISPELLKLSNENPLRLLNGFFFWTALLLLPLYVFLRLRAGRLYATGLLDAVRSGAVDPAQLVDWERNELTRLGLLQADQPARRHPIIRVAAKTSVLSLQGAAMLAAVLIWFVVIAQTYIAQFFNYVPGRWLNQPLVQVPSMRFIPAHLKAPPGR